MTASHLIGFGPSVYTRAVRMACVALGVRYHWVPRNPFEDEATGHPFARVPVWQDADATIYETAAILTWIEARYGAASTDPLYLARTAQVGAIVDNYAYWPLVRQVFVHGVVRDPGEADAGEVGTGMAKAPGVLQALDDIAAEGAVLSGPARGRADWHLAPMLAAFVKYPPACDMVAGYGALSRWWRAMQSAPEFVATQDPPR